MRLPQPTNIPYLPIYAVDHLKIRNLRRVNLWAGRDITNTGTIVFPSWMQLGRFSRSANFATVQELL
ncbi:hypothetical protein CPB84DRAFT_1793981 [Gymnopilus junonius]|uniref:Uncharacterized protein n=1 Tax=Gymnopilus junonius TaxID=109634 RepID=A0A9P5NDN5_GYMJU|nr:hypothetical protein CPB84DRAFT_1793981 [Gymnopilus junonius]